MDPFADQVHADGGTDGRNVVGAEGRNDRIQRRKDIVPRNDDLMVVAANVVRHFPRVFQVNGVHVHANGKGFQRAGQFFSGNAADERGVQAAGEQEPDRGVRIQTLLHARYEPVMDFPGNGFHVVVTVGLCRRRVRVADERAVLVVVPGRERTDVCADAHQDFRFRRKVDAALRVIPVVKGPDADGVSGGNVGVFLPVVDDEGEFRVQEREHGAAEALVEREQDLAVAVAPERVSERLQIGFQRPEPVEFPVADTGVFSMKKGLHTIFVQPHDGEPTEPQVSMFHRSEAAHVGSAGLCPGQQKFSCRLRTAAAAVSKYCTHKRILL